MARTALAEKLADEGLALKDYRGAETVEVFSDPRDEFEAVRSSAGVYDLGWRSKLVLTGSDRVRWLNGMITNNVRDLPVNRGVYAFVLSPQGRILGDLYAYNRGDSLLIDTDQGQAPKLLELFDHYIIMDDVEVTNVSDKLTAFGVTGPDSATVLGSIGVEVPELQPLQFADVMWQQIGLTIVRSDFPTVDAYEIWVSPVNVNTLWEALLKGGATPVGSEALERLRIASGIP